MGLRQQTRLAAGLRPEEKRPAPGGHPPRIYFSVFADAVFE
jgi:hypothetical protein